MRMFAPTLKSSLNYMQVHLPHYMRSLIPLLCTNGFLLRSGWCMTLCMVTTTGFLLRNPKRCQKSEEAARRYEQTDWEREYDPFVTQAEKRSDTWVIQFVSHQCEAHTHTHQTHKPSQDMLVNPWLRPEFKWEGSLFFLCACSQSEHREEK